MIKRTALFITLAAVVGTTLPQKADAGYGCTTGRVAALTANSISVVDRERVVTFGRDGRTQYTKWITQGGWQQPTRFDQKLIPCDLRVLGFDPLGLEVGRLVVVHPRHSNDNVARWVQVASDVSIDQRLCARRYQR
jgi:hypothetical protein